MAPTTPRDDGDGDGDGDGDEPRALPGDVSDASALVAGLGARVRAVLHDVTNLVKTIVIQLFHQ